MLRDGLDADEAIGAQVVGPGGATVGSITDLLVDEGGRVVRAIVDVGAAVGAGSKPVAVELDRLRRAGDHLVLDMGAERLAALPGYRLTRDRWVRGP
jgi:sporulation protein YlmC with PRC-barrel domain